MPNLFEGRNTAQAVISWPAGVMKVESQSGFQIIYDNSALVVGQVFMVLSDSAPTDLSPLDSVQVSAQQDAGGIPGDHGACGWEIAGPLLVPINSKGRKVLKVTCTAVTAAGVGTSAKVGFALTVTQQTPVLERSIP